MKGIACAALLLFLISLSFSASNCSGRSTLGIPAVFGDNSTIAVGEMVNTTLTLREGNNTVYISNIKNVGESTIISALDALKFAFSYSNSSFDGCSAEISMNSEDLIGEIEGPSAGLGFAILGYSALNSLPARHDATITGSTDRRGRAFPVGGIYEKAKAGAIANLTYFVSPPILLYEKILLIPLQKKYGIRPVEVKNAREAIDFFIFGKAPQNNSEEAARAELPNITPYDSGGMEDFRKLAQEVISLERGKVGAIQESKYSEGIKRQMEGLIPRQEYILERGYYFTAANDAFNGYIDSATAQAAIGEENFNLEKKKGDIRECINSLTSPKKNVVNYELLIGADVRRAWAIDKIGESSSKGPLREELYGVYHELMYADGWCRISQAMSQIASEEKEGEPLDETRWKTVAAQRIAFAEGLKIGNNEWLRHLRVAKLLYDNEKYGAAALDATFAAAMTQVDREVSSGSLSKAETERRILALGNDSKYSLWGSIYRAHGNYLAQTNDSIIDAYRMLAYAAELDQLNAELRTAADIRQATLSSPPPRSLGKDAKARDDVQEIIQRKNKPSTCPISFVLAAIALFQFIRPCAAKENA